MSQSTTTANADAAELAKFQALAAKWWDPNAEFRPLHEINPLRLGWIEAKVSLSGSRVLDVGCGGGILAEAMAGRGADVLGIDLAERSLAVAELHALESGAQVRYERIAAEDLAAREPAGFDVVTCMEMLEHVPDPQSTIRACATLVKPGGWVFFSTINRNPRSFLFAIIGAEYILRLLPKGTHEYARFIRPSELATGARSAGLDELAWTGLTYNPLTRQYRLDARDLSVNYVGAFRRASQ
jgi:2-polyprenyl-6-hydroxyphenyl methylase/3-demethylubiquinone-9 3-methyltransferase